MHPFATQMADVLTESGKRANRTSLETHLRRHSEMAFRQNIKSMQELCDEVVQDRITNPQPEVHDLLNNMLNTSDPVTGEKLSAENIRYQMATFLVRYNPEKAESPVMFLTISDCWTRNYKWHFSIPLLPSSSKP